MQDSSKQEKHKKASKQQQGRSGRKSKSIENNLLLIFIRYLTLLIVGIFLHVFQEPLFYITAFPVYGLLKIFYPVYICGRSLFLYGVAIELNEACIALSAYYLLFLLNLSIAMPIKKRVFSLLFSFFSFLFVNVIRILFLTYLYFYHSIIFDITHRIFWHLVSTVFVIVIWFLSVRVFSIYDLPFYSDIKKIMILRNKRTD